MLLTEKRYIKKSFIGLTWEANVKYIVKYF